MFGDGASERGYFEDLRHMVRGKRIKPVDLGVSGVDKILSKCKNFVRNEGVDIKNGDMVAIVTDHDFRYDEESIIRLHSEC